MKRILISLLIAAMLISLLAGCTKTPAPDPNPPAPPATGEKSDPNNPLVIIEMVAGGVIEIELFPEVAPNTVRSVIHLVESGFYDGLDFDYIMDDFLVIGGNSPEGTGYRIAGEFASNGFANNLSHTRGVVSMFNGGHPDSGSSEFLIMLSDAPHLDGYYAAFGKVINGLDVVERISRGPASDEGWALEPVETMKKVTVDTVGQSYEKPEAVEVWDTSKPNPVVTLEIEAGGTIKLELLPEVAFNTVRNFVALVEKGFYDGLKFHRIIPGFMIQGGDPQGNGSGGPGHYIHGEFAVNGIRNPLSHQPGVVSMARSQHNDSAGSQFFIVVGDATFLDGQYAGFGRVIEGMEVAERIVNGPSDQAQNGLALEPREVIKKATVETFGVDIGAPKVFVP